MVEEREYQKSDLFWAKTRAVTSRFRPRRPVKFNPAESETYRAIQEQNYDHYPSQTTEHSALTRVYATKPVPNTKVIYRY